MTADIELTLETGYDVFQLLLKSIKDHFAPGKTNEAYAYVHHLWSPFFASRQDFKTIKQLAKLGSVHYCSQSTSPLDKILAKFYSQFNAKVKLGIDLKHKEDIFCVGDLVISVKIPPGLKSSMDTIYSDTKSILSFNLMQFFKAFSEKTFDIKVLVVRDKAKAETFKDMLNDLFV